MSSQSVAKIMGSHPDRETIPRTAELLGALVVSHELSVISLQRRRNLRVETAPTAAGQRLNVAFYGTSAPGATAGDVFAVLLTGNRFAEVRNGRRVWEAIRGLPTTKPDCAAPSEFAQLAGPNFHVRVAGWKSQPVKP